MEAMAKGRLLIRLAVVAALGLAAVSAVSRPLADRPPTSLPPASVGSATIQPVEPAVLVGDGSLRDKLDWNNVSVRDGKYVAALNGGGKAILTLDPAIQRAAEEVLERAKAPLGAIVVTDISGQVLAFAGRRNQSPAKAKDFTLPGAVWAPAASVFKIVTSAALLSQGVSPDSKVCFHGGLRSVDPDHLIDNPARDRRCESLKFGLAHSQNAIIAKLSNRHLSKVQLRDFAKRFGFDEPLPCAAASDASTCSIPAEPLELARTAAGFWNSELSALGGSIIANTVASGGLLVAPRVVSEVVHPDGSKQPVVSATPRRVLKKGVAANLAGMMEHAVAKGTGRKGFYNRRGRPYLQQSVAGKTGSLSRNEPTYLGYSWFVGFAPVDKPKYVISVVLGNPMKWHLKGHTAARLVLQRTFSASR